MFVRGGYVSPGNDLNYAGNEGDYWSSVSYYSYYAYHLYFNSGVVYPSTNGYRYYGFSLRCVALGSHIRFIAKTT